MYGARSWSKMCLREKRRPVKFADCNHKTGHFGPGGVTTSDDANCGSPHSPLEDHHCCSATTLNYMKASLESARCVAAAC
jgi:hypothetical protein